MHIDKWRVYGLPVVMNVARFITFCGNLSTVDPGVISP